MSTPDKNIKENISLTGSQLEDIFELLYRYSRLAINREITHSINNTLTALSVQKTLMMHAVRSGDYKKMVQRLEAINKAIYNLEEFSSTLATSVQITPKPKEVSINQGIVNIVKFAKELTSLKHCEFFLDLYEEADILLIDFDSIKVLLLSFFKLATHTYTTPVLSLRTAKNSDRGTFLIKAIAKEGQKDSTKPLRKGDVRDVGLKLGEISLTTMKRMIQSIHKNIEIHLMDDKDLGFTCEISSI